MNGSSTRALTRMDDFLNYDFCPWANRWVYWMKHPLVGVAVVAITAGICGAFVAPQAWLLSAGLLTVGAIGLVWPAVSISAVRAEVHFAQAWCEEGTSTCVDVTLTNRLPLPIWGLSLHGGDTSDEVLVSFARVPGWKASKYQWRFTPDRRGQFPRTPLQLQTGFPFGVWTAKRKATVSGDLLVLPKAFDLDAVPALATQGWGDDQFSTKRVGDAGDVMGTRWFRPGDSLRQIHWATTARTGALICTERQMTVQNRLTLFLDVDAKHHQGTGPDSSLEWSIRVFAGICEELASQGNEIRAVFGHDNVDVQAGVLGQRRLLSRLAKLPEEGISDSPVFKGQPDVVVMTDRSPEIQSSMKVILKAAGFDETVTEAEVSHDGTGSFETGSVVISNRADLDANLRTSWRRACHAVS